MGERTGMQGKGLISVIVPVYNVEQYLAACIQSILQQSYAHWELILVDDGSTDGSGALCDFWQKSEKRIRVVHQKNGGLSAARNRGIREARGEYLCFVDADDWVHREYLRVLYENIRAFDADVSCCRYTAVPDGQAEGIGKNIQRIHSSNTPRLCTREELWDTLTDVGADCRSTWLVVAWNKLIRSEIAKTLSFPVGKWHEDEFFIHRLLLKTDRFVDTPIPLYFYRKRAAGISGENNRLDIRHLDLVDAWEERVKAYGKDRKRRKKLGESDQSLLYQNMIAAYRMTIRIQYGNFPRGIPAIRLKLRYLWSCVQYPKVRGYRKRTGEIEIKNRAKDEEAGGRI